MKIQGNTFIITGGAGGIGSAVGADLYSRGASVALFDVIPQEAGDKVAAALTGGEGKAIYVQADITDSDKCKTAVASVVVKLGNLVGLVHCAGIAIKRKWSNVVSASTGDLEKMFKVNSIGTFIINAQFADAVNKPLNFPNGENEPEADFWTTDEERGIIINFSSAAAHGLYARTLCYGPSKAAVAGISKSLADFLGPSGIRVNTISPSIVQSGMTNAFAKYFGDDLLSHATFPRVGAVPDDITPTVRYLIENKFVNSEDIRVDGGWKLVTAKPGSDGGPDPRTLAPGLE